jgi:predicted AAA+ superfamily ATPase
LIKTPKLHIGDTGLACALLGWDVATLTADRTLFGQMLETFVFQELRRLASGYEDDVRFYHYRDKEDAEVDVVMELAGGRIAGVEVKASGTVTAADFRGLRKLRDATEKRFAAGVVLYDGESDVGFGDRLHAISIRALWEAN